MRRRYRLDEKEFSEINITPFTDVILVLLIIFMITSPFLISGAFNVKLPKAVSADTQANQDVEVYLTQTNDVIIDGKTIPPDGVVGALKAQFIIRNNSAVIIKADKSVLHGNFIQLLDMVKLSGASKVLVATTKTNDEPAKTSPQDKE
ncbi:MAG: biopolymer transporter ExbD [Ignavibacteriales bacterium]|nr:biopolymer transporter ExbD [Ignavibacteriales bacterium]